VRFDEEEINSLVSELFQDGLIIKTIGACEFSHLSFQEYFTARHYIGDPSQRGIRKALRAFLRGDRWWRQVLRFYIGLSGSPREVDDWITKEEYKLEDYSAEGIGFYTEELRRIITDLYPHS
jgi:predicted NACHT family NTPase